MTSRVFSSLTALTLPLLAQNGDHKDHQNMNDVVPADLIPEAPVLSVDEAIKAFTIQEGFTIEPVAAEPLVEKPVALAFDSRGRMWVCEMRGYMPTIDGEGEDQPTGRIAILEDTDGDGQVDKRITFLDNILLPRSIALVPGGVLFADQNKLYFAEREGDQLKGALQVVDRNYSAGGNVEHKTNGLMPALDNWMYNAKSAYRYQWRDGKLSKEKTPFRGQWGITQDNWGRIFTNSNSTLLQGDLFQPNVLSGNSLVKIKKRMAVRVGSNRVYPGRVTPGVNRAYISTLNGYDRDTINPKTFKLINATGACGPVIYRGDQFPTRFQGMAFVAESAAQLIKAIAVSRRDDKLSGSHPYEDSEFLTSTDERFRPVNLYNAPDGSLYVLDFYHGIIQHKTYMTTYLRRQTLSRKLEGPGFGHGRIYRIRAVDRPLNQVPDLEKASLAELTQTLRSKNGALRDLAQKLIIDRADEKALPHLRKLLVGKALPLTKAHALWTIEGLGDLTVSDVTTAISSGHPELRLSGLYAALTLEEDERVQMITLLDAVPEDQRAARPLKARFLAGLPNTEAQEKLVALLQKHGKSAFVRMAAIAGMETTAKLFQEVNQKRFQEKTFDELLAQTLKGPQVNVDPVDFLKGDHLSSYKRGKELYMGRAACIGCHGADGAGLPNLGPTLDKSDWVTGHPDELALVLLHGLEGPIKVNGKDFIPQAFMPGLAQNPTITDQDLADIMTYLRHGWSNRASQVKKGEVYRVRRESAGRAGKMMKMEDFPAKQ